MNRSTTSKTERLAHLPKSLERDLFLSADAELIEVAKQTNLQATNVEREAEKILGSLPTQKER